MKILFRQVRFRWILFSLVTNFRRVKKIKQTLKKKNRSKRININENAMRTSQRKI